MISSGDAPEGDKQEKQKERKTGKQMSKKEATEQQEQEEIADTRAGAVATVQTGAVSTEVTVKGASVRFATLSPYYGVSAVSQECAQECKEGDFYLKTGKTSAWRFSGSGKKNAVRAFVLDGRLGLLEGFKGGGGQGQTPRTWVVGRPKAAGSTETLASIQECVAAAKAETGGAVPIYRFEDYSKQLNPIPDHYISRCLYLELLVKCPEDFTGDVSLVKVGGGLYTPARVLFKKFDVMKVEQFFNNIQVREEVRHRGEEGWKWSPYGQVVSIYTNGVEFTRPNGSKGYIWTPTVEAALGDDGKLYKPDDEEREDLTRFATAMADTKVDASEISAEDSEL